MSGSRTIIAAEDRLDNVHPGDILRLDFLIGTDIAIEDVAAGTGIPTDRLAALLATSFDVDADIDLRLGRYFGLSEGYFLRLQNAYDLEEAWRAHGDELDRIVPRAA